MRLKSKDLENVVRPPMEPDKFHFYPTMEHNSREPRGLELSLQQKGFFEQQDYMSRTKQSVLSHVSSFTLYVSWRFYLDEV